MSLLLDVLRKARRLARPGAWLALETPNIDSGIARIFGRKWCDLVCIVEDAWVLPQARDIRKNRHHRPWVFIRAVHPLGRWVRFL